MSATLTAEVMAAMGELNFDQLAEAIRKAIRENGFMDEASYHSLMQLLQEKALAETDEQSA